MICSSYPRCYAYYVATRSGSVPTDYGWTAQHNDGTGLIYMHARYYDPATGQFVSPDTFVPDPGNVYAYNRYMYGYGNPVKYSDPSGHQSCAAGDTACWQQDWQSKNNWYNARGYFWGNGHWSEGGNPVFANEGLMDEVAGDAGVSWSADAGLSWTADRKRGVASGLVRFGNKLIGGFAGSGLLALRALLGGGATMHLQSMNVSPCNVDAPCAFGSSSLDIVYWPDMWFAGKSLDQIGSTAVHELAHIIDWHSLASVNFAVHGGVPVTAYAQCAYPSCVPLLEQWAEGVTAFVYGQDYTRIGGLSPLGPLVNNQGRSRPASAALLQNQAAIIGPILGAR